jgi:rRNA processing protein Gar1
MRILLSRLLGLFLLLLTYSCSLSAPNMVQKSSDIVPGYEIVIRFFESGNAIGKVMDIFGKNGFIVARVQQSYLSTEKLEIRINIRGGNSKKLNEIEFQLRSVLNIESVSISKI